MVKLADFYELRDFVTEKLNSRGRHREVDFCRNNDDTYSVVVTVDEKKYKSFDYGLVGTENTCKEVVEMHGLGSIFYI